MKPAVDVDRADLAVGVDFGGTKMLGVAVDRDGAIIAEHRVPTPYDEVGLLDSLAGIVRTLQDAAGGTVAGLGVGAAGLVDRAGTLQYGPNVGGVTNVGIRTAMEERLPGQVVRVDNDANAATWAECLLGAGRRRREMVLVTLGTGIGGGLVTGGKLFRGQNGYGAEFGHMTVDAKGVQCICGLNGCWEAYASGRALGRMGRKAAEAGTLDKAVELAGGQIENIRGEHVTHAARLGASGALAVMDDFAWWVACGVASIISIADPELVVLGGGLAEENALFLPAAQRHLQDLTFGVRNRPAVPLVVATLGERAGAVGAAMLVHGDEMPEIQSVT